MFIFYGISIIILYRCVITQSVQINKIQNARIPNTPSSLQFNCSTCICQCLTKMHFPSPSFCCYVNCFTEQNTCQIILSSAENTPRIITDQTSVVYRTNCFNSSSARSFSATSMGITLFTSTMVTSSMMSSTLTTSSTTTTRTTSTTTTTRTTSTMLSSTMMAGVVTTSTVTASPMTTSTMMPGVVTTSTMTASPMFTSTMTTSTMTISTITEKSTNAEADAGGGQLPEEYFANVTQIYTLG